MSLFSIIITIVLALLFGGLSWIAVFLIRKLLNVSENIYKLQNDSREYLEHLDRVYNMELFYGNEILLELLEHSREYHEDIADFVEKYGEGSNEKRET
jgi:predicted PurR-regulated permease PerM